AELSRYLPDSPDHCATILRSIVMRLFLAWDAFIMSASLPALADGSRGTADEAKALVVKAAAYLKEMGPETAFAAFNDKSNPSFHDRDLYILARAMDGKMVAHGANTGMIGRTSLQLKDADGKLHNKEMIERAQSKGSG